LTKPAPAALVGTALAALPLPSATDLLWLSHNPVGSYLGDAYATGGSFTPGPGKRSWWYWALFLIPLLLLIVLKRRQTRGT
jgi:hypothetical protein